LVGTGEVVMKMVDNEQEHRVSSLKDWEVTWYHGDFGY